MIRVSLDGRHIKGSGIGTYTENLISQYKQHGVDVSVYCKKDQVQYFSSINVKTSMLDARIYGIKEQYEMIKIIKRKKQDILHWPHYNIPLMYKGPLVVTIHDIIHLKFPQFLPNKAAYHYAYFMIDQAVKKADKIITDSNNTKLDLIERFKVQEEKIEVIYIGVSKDFKKDKMKEIDIKRQYGIGKPYILYIGNVRAHKNIKGLIRAYKKFRDVCKAYELIIVGEEHNNLKDIEIDDDIRMLGYVEDRDLPNLYGGASLFVFPSLYEGFGLPPLEAMACGTPVITSNTSSLPEVVGDAAITINPYNTDEIAKAMYDVLINHKLAQSLIRKGYDRVKQFDWSTTAEKTLKIYEEVLRSY
ncbi:glycosyltransferase family 4 protein [Geosporobacter ferrireducens]|uniref:glycosyltransferase family 4 protein n=1 Tax=Geosporobacter ferrireducens TaxID=1424294 RepID=UPI002352545B|nr:glycosyltransferase family 1 protein [Geosporobacter ferrireducens]